MQGFDCKTVLETIEREKITHMYLPPSAVYTLLDFPDLNKFDTRSLQKLYVGPSPISPHRFKQAVDVLAPFWRNFTVNQKPVSRYL